ncbi:MAG TPA: hypothetical protein VNM38_01300 [Solirubrobacterales bacterium]|nr:hypothetical protein [Solirubrobacterales bacterium]
MSKKMMLLALAAVTAVMFVLPAAASANWGVTPGNAKFSAAGPAGKLFAGGEPTIECKGPNTGSGEYENGTTGKLNLHFTECQAEFLGITVPCSTTVTNPSLKTIVTSGTFHNVTITNGKRGVLVTPEPTTIKCQNIANLITVNGSVIGEVTSPANSSPCVTLNNIKTIAFKFGVSGGSQVHKTHDAFASTEFDLTATTTGGSAVTAALEATATNTFTEPKEVTIDCNNP